MSRKMPYEMEALTKDKKFRSMTHLEMVTMMRGELLVVMEQVEAMQHRMKLFADYMHGTKGWDDEAS